MPGADSKDGIQSVTQQLSGMGVQVVGMEVGKEMNFNEERSRVVDRESMGGKSRSSMVGLEKERSESSAKEEEAKVDNTGLGAEATRGVVEGNNRWGEEATRVVVEGNNMGNKQ